jgi:DNA-binding NtrC family response regulator
MNNKIVLIDDDEDILDVVHYILVDEGYNVAMYDHLQPLDKIIEQQPSVI